jgi:hypothetical protein
MVILTIDMIWHFCQKVLDLMKSIKNQNKHKAKTMYIFEKQAKIWKPTQKIDNYCNI